jgi:hypothetical protein
MTISNKQWMEQERQLLGVGQVYSTSSVQAEAAEAQLRSYLAASLRQPWSARLVALRNFSFSGATGNLESLMELAAYGRTLAAEYEAQQVPPPQWLSENLKLVAEAIKATWRQERLAKLKAAEDELGKLRTQEEKRAAKEEEVRRLREELG